MVITSVFTDFLGYFQCTLQELKKILTQTRVSKDSDSNGGLLGVICLQKNIAQIYFTIRRSDLHFWDDSDIHRFPN